MSYAEQIANFQAGIDAADKALAIIEQIEDGGNADVDRLLCQAVDGLMDLKKALTRDIECTESFMFEEWTRGTEAETLHTTYMDPCDLAKGTIVRLVTDANRDGLCECAIEGTDVTVEFYVSELRMLANPERVGQ